MKNKILFTCGLREESQRQHLRKKLVFTCAVVPARSTLELNTFAGLPPMYTLRYNLARFADDGFPEERQGGCYFIMILCATYETSTKPSWELINYTVGDGERSCGKRGAAVSFYYLFRMVEWRRHARCWSYENICEFWIKTRSVHHPPLIYCSQLTI